MPCDTEVERFKDNVQDRPGKEKQATTCTDNWTTVKSVKENQIQVFEQTECIAEMKQSGELYVPRTKYGLAAVNQFLNICGKNQAVGHDIGCASKKMITASSLGTKAQKKQLKVVVNACHGFAHNHMCQLENHLLYQLGFGNEDLETCKCTFSSSNNMSLLIHHASEFHWKQFLDLHFSQWDSDKYLELSQFLYNNYKQALHTVQTNMAELEQFKCRESDTNLIAVQCIKLLEKLSFTEATYGSVTQVPYLTYTPTEFTSTASLNESAWQGTNPINAEYASMLQKYWLQLNIMAKFECQYNIINCWTPLHHEYINACEYMKHHAFIHTVEELEGSPGKNGLDYAEVVRYSLLGEFSLLKHSHYKILEKLWALPDNCEMMVKLQAWLDFDGEKMKVTAQGFKDLGSLELASEMELMHTERLQRIYEMPGYMGHRLIGSQLQAVCDGASNKDEEDNDNDNDNGEAFHLGDMLDQDDLSSC
ncbi:hypothetical protein F5141DRAFT_1068074 [Pisolithus sp. B1]|nr:hypothetical protein F5141DRAFT_1068074 [Pisolithus sp. B1]